ncbi:hypothetical protein LTR28_007830 [Elasticomyces elasticus]|nr:hypothetical protein LTR28_007830 [Elasticomyces elasticus]
MDPMGSCGVGFINWQIHAGCMRLRRRIRPIDLWGILHEMLDGCSVKYLVIDGLDEMEECRSKYHTNVRADFLKRLWETISATPTRLLIVSRYDLDIERVIPTDLGPATAVMQCKIDMLQIAEDLERVARHEMEAKFATNTPEAREEIVRALVT